MKYSLATIPCEGLEQWQIDLLTQELADLGFDSFEQDADTLRAYIPTAQLETIHSQLEDFFHLSPFHTASADRSRLYRDKNFQFSIESCPDENWNAVWEAEHAVEELPLGVRIVPHCAFGAGHHETTSMMISELMATDLSGKRVFDHGTGTGVLAIFAKRMGADYVLADDIDDNSVRNARENAELNGVDIDVRLAAADAVLSPFNFQFSPFTFQFSPFNFQFSPFNLILANIHRNVLIAQMPSYAHLLADGGELWLSGFYESDIPALLEAATAEHLHLIATRANNEWRLLRLGK